MTTEQQIAEILLRLERLEAAPKGRSTQGVKGEDGATISWGSGEPSDDDGNNGDLYVRTDTKSLYGKEGDAWGELVSLQGEQGEPGDQGADGAAGPGAPALKGYAASGLSTTVAYGQDNGGNTGLWTLASRVWAAAGEVWRVKTGARSGALSMGHTLTLALYGAATIDGSPSSLGSVNVTSSDGTTQKESADITIPSGGRYIGIAATFDDGAMGNYGEALSWQARRVS